MYASNEQTSSALVALIALIHRPPICERRAVGSQNSRNGGTPFSLCHKDFASRTSAGLFEGEVDRQVMS
jgi:hypothetical protein